MNELLLNTINNIQNKTSEIPCINDGGCCQFAKFLAQQLEIRKIKFKIVFCNSCVQTKKEIIANLKSNKEITDGVNHVMVKIDDLCIDGEYSTKNPPYKNGKRPSVHLLKYSQIKILADADVWNFFYCKKKYNKEIAKIIKNEFLNYDRLKRNAN